MSFTYILNLPNTRFNDTNFLNSMGNSTYTLSAAMFPLLICLEGTVHGQISQVLTWYPNLLVNCTSFYPDKLCFKQTCTCIMQSVSMDRKDNAILRFTSHNHRQVILSPTRMLVRSTLKPCAGNPLS